MQATNLFVSLLLLFCTGFAIAGADNATLDCVSTAAKDSKIWLEGSIPGDLAEFSLTLRSGGAEVTMSDASDTIKVIDNFKNSVFILSVTRKKGNALFLYALPATMTHKAGPNGGMDAHFAAVLEEAPRPSLKAGSRASEMVITNIPLSCAYHYSI